MEKSAIGETLEKIPAGGKAVVKQYVEDMIKAVALRNEKQGDINEISCWISQNEKIDRCYQFLNGFIWGLAAGHVITDEEIEEVQKELIEMTN